MAYTAVLEAREIASKKMGTFREAMRLREERKAKEKEAEENRPKREEMKTQSK